ncbi:MAG TPA: metal-dependent hydrolase [Trichocoleus sp.]
MNTPSHFLMTAALDKALPRVPIHRQAFLLGSVAPDIALWLLSIGGMVYYRFILGWSSQEAFDVMFDNLYFHNPFWIAAHNLLHAPILLLLGIGLVWRKRRNIGSSSRFFFWFLLACLLHAGVDILTHVDDGPVLFFPFSWTVRFHSSVSYWDPRHYGREFGLFEAILNSLLILYLLRGRVCSFISRFRQKNSADF